MARKLRNLLRRTPNPLLEMGGVNLGAAPRPIQPPHGRPQSPKGMPQFGADRQPGNAAKPKPVSGGRSPKKGVAAGNLRKNGPAIKQTGVKQEMGGKNTGKVRWTDKSDDRWDKQHGIKEGSKADRKLDKARGVPENDARKKKRKKLSPIVKETRAIRKRMKRPAPYAV